MGRYDDGYPDCSLDFGSKTIVVFAFSIERAKLLLCMSQIRCCPLIFLIITVFPKGLVCLRAKFLKAFSLAGTYSLLKLIAKVRINFPFLAEV